MDISERYVMLPYAHTMFGETGLRRVLTYETSMSMLGPVTACTVFYSLSTRNGFFRIPKNVTGLYTFGLINIMLIPRVSLGLKI